MYLESPLSSALVNLNRFVRSVSSISSFQSPLLGSELAHVGDFTKRRRVRT